MTALGISKITRHHKAFVFANTQCIYICLLLSLSYFPLLISKKELSGLLPLFNSAEILVWDWIDQVGIRHRQRSEGVYAHRPIAVTIPTNSTLKV